MFLIAVLCFVSLNIFLAKCETRFSLTLDKKIVPTTENLTISVDLSTSEANIIFRKAEIRLPATLLFSATLRSTSCYKNDVCIEEHYDFPAHFQFDIEKASFFDNVEIEESKKILLFENVAFTFNMSSFRCEIFLENIGTENREKTAQFVIGFAKYENEIGTATERFVNKNFDLRPLNVQISKIDGADLVRNDAFLPIFSRVPKSMCAQIDYEQSIDEIDINVRVPPELRVLETSYAATEDGEKISIPLDHVSETENGTSVTATLSTSGCAQTRCKMFFHISLISYDRYEKDSGKSVDIKFETCYTFEKRHCVQADPVAMVIIGIQKDVVEPLSAGVAKKEEKTLEQPQDTRVDIQKPQWTVANAVEKTAASDLHEVLYALNMSNAEFFGDHAADVHTAMSSNDTAKSKQPDPDDRPLIDWNLNSFLFGVNYQVPVIERTAVPATVPSTASAATSATSAANATSLITAGAPNTTSPPVSTTRAATTPAPSTTTTSTSGGADYTDEDFLSALMALFGILGGGDTFGVMPDKIGSDANETTSATMPSSTTAPTTTTRAPTAGPTTRATTVSNAALDTGKSPCKPGWWTLEMQLNDVCYYSPNKRLTYAHAEEACRQVGGHLPSFHTTFDFLALATFWTNNIDAQDVWIGLNKNSSRNDWQWTDGSQMAFDDWCSTDAPDGFTGCTVSSIESDSSYCWIQKKCETEFYFFCAQPTKRA